MSIENFPSNISPIKDPDRLLQDVDINRLRAVVFRDVVSDNGAGIKNIPFILHYCDLMLQVIGLFENFSVNI